MNNTAKMRSTRFVEFRPLAPGSTLSSEAASLVSRIVEEVRALPGIPTPDEIDEAFFRILNRRSDIPMEERLEIVDAAELILTGTQH